MLQHVLLDIDSVHPALTAHYRGGRARVVTRTHTKIPNFHPFP